MKFHDSQTYRKIDVTRERILELRKSAPVVQNRFRSCHCCCRLCYPGEYLKLGNLVRYNWPQVLKACDCLNLLPASREKGFERGKKNNNKKTTTTKTPHQNLEINWGTRNVTCNSYNNSLFQTAEKSAKVSKTRALFSRPVCVKMTCFAVPRGKAENHMASHYHTARWLA